MGRTNRTGIKWRSKEDPRHRAKMNEYNKTYVSKHKSKRYESNRTYLLKKYGLTFEEFESLLKEQEGKCAICKNVEMLQVDHCHKTGKVRGLLCRVCNIGLGHFRDDKNLLIKAAEYLK